MVIVHVPGQRWEVEFFADDHVELERFISTGEISGAEALDDLFRDFSSQQRYGDGLASRLTLDS